MRLFLLMLFHLTHNGFSHISLKYFSPWKLQLDSPWRSLLLPFNLSRILVCMIPYAFIFCTVTAFAMPDTRICSVEYGIKDNQDTVTLYLNRPTTYSTITLKNPDRIVLDIQNCFLPDVHLVKAVNGKVIQSYRISQNTKNITRVVLDIKERCKYNIIPSPVSIVKNFTLTVKVAPESQDNISSFSKTENNDYTTVTTPSAAIAKDTPSEMTPKESTQLNTPAAAISDNTPSEVTPKESTQLNTPAAIANNIPPKETPPKNGQLNTPAAIAGNMPLKETPQKNNNRELNTKENPNTKTMYMPSEPNVIAFESDIPDDVFSNLGPDAIPSWETRSDKAPPFSISGSMLTRFHTDTVHRQPPEDSNANEQTEGAVSRIIFSTEYRDLVTLSAISDYRYAGRRTRSETYDLDLHEAYIKYSGDILSLKIGKQIRRWGKADQFSPVDTLNPEDLREFVTLEYEDRKIPVWMADATLKLGNFSLEAVYIPFFEPSRIDYFGTDWAVYTHLKEDIQSDASIPAPVKNYFQQMGIHSTDPDDNDLNGEYALRIATTVNGWDLGATYHRTWEDSPFFKSFPLKNVNLSGGLMENGLTSTLDNAQLTQEMIETTYMRGNITGFEFETIVSNLGFRGELAWHDRQPFLTSSFVSINKPVLYSIIGADYTSKDNWYLNFQLSYIHISGYQDNILFFKKNSLALMGEMNKDIFSSWVNLSLHYNISLNENQFYISPRIKYSYIPNLDIIFGAHIFEGNTDSYIGKFDENDQIFLDLEYHF